MAQNKINVPSGFGGLINYGEEYESRFKVKPEHIILFIILVILFVIALKIFWPITVV